MTKVQQLEQQEAARKQWIESEWRLNFLRTQTGTELPPPTAEEILQWYLQNQPSTIFTST